GPHFVNLHGRKMGGMRRCRKGQGTVYTTATRKLSYGKKAFEPGEAQWLIPAGRASPPGRLRSAVLIQHNQRIDQAYLLRFQLRQRVCNVLGLHLAPRVTLTIDQQDAEVLATQRRTQVVQRFEIARVAAE